LIDESVSYGKEIGGVSGKTETFLKGIRSEINNKLKGMDKNYDKVNTDYSETRRVIDGIEDMARSMDFTSSTADASMGTLLRSLLSNNRGRSALIDSINDLHKVSTKYGYKVKQDPTRLMLFANTLDKRFGSSAEMGFMGQTQQANKLAIDDALSKQGLINKAIDKGFDMSSGLNQDNAIKSLRGLLDYEQ
jgi:hypothetical protein